MNQTEKITLVWMIREDIFMNKAYLLTGGNIGDRHANLQKAASTIAERCGEVIRSSWVYETAAWGKEDQQDFLNQVLLINTNLTADKLIRIILQIEKEMGRSRKEKNEPRVIDIDILFFNDEIINDPDLIVPHPQLQNRRFVLQPLNEIAPDFIHPIFRKTVHQLLLECPDALAVKKL
jgi:2-amino-4-hydroxy-6-hydroxymethyldihydropteridine diphosphokinase